MRVVTITITNIPDVEGGGITPGPEFLMSTELSLVLIRIICPY